MTFQHPGTMNELVLESYLDLEIYEGILTELPRPETVSRPSFINGYDSGTAVTWFRPTPVPRGQLSSRQ